MHLKSNKQYAKPPKFNSAIANPNFILWRDLASRNIYVASGNGSRANIAARGRNVRNAATATAIFFWGKGRDQSQGQPSKLLHTPLTSSECELEAVGKMGQGRGQPSRAAYGASASISNVCSPRCMAAVDSRSFYY